jgi:predicted TIM-barrel fold metal-dependent hydrolase
MADQRESRISEEGSMAIIDADTHVDECEDTWAYMAPSEARFRPVTLVPTQEMVAGTTPPGYTRHWLIDGHLSIRRIRDDKRTGTTVEARELHDVQARLRHMDEMGVDIHVMYPTLFLTYLTSDPATQTALCKSYNRWLADRASQSNGRLRWVAVLPMLDIDAAVDELRWARDKGACGVFKLATEVGRKVTDPYFFPVYEEASALDLPVCIHTGSGDPSPDGGGVLDGLGGTTMLDAFFRVVFSGLPAQFPKLRFGFIEAGASWVPYVLDRLQARRERMAWAYSGFKYTDEKEDLFRQNRLFVTCQTIEDVPYLLRFGTEDNLLIGTDYSHADQSAEIDSLRILQGWGEDGTLSKDAVRKILEANPKEFYGL